MHLLFPLLVSLWLLALCHEDLRHRRLPNALTLGGAAVALVWQLGAGSWPAFISGLSGGLLASLLLILPFLLHSAGGGDVKMLFAVGALVGRGGILGCVFGGKHRREIGNGCDRRLRHLGFHGSGHG